MTRNLILQLLVACSSKHFARKTGVPPQTYLSTSGFVFIRREGEELLLRKLKFVHLLTIMSHHNKEIITCVKQLQLTKTLSGLKLTL